MSRTWLLLAALLLGGCHIILPLSGNTGEPGPPDLVGQDMAVDTTSPTPDLPGDAGGDTSPLDAGTPALPDEATAPQPDATPVDTTPPPPDTSLQDTWWVEPLDFGPALNDGCPTCPTGQNNCCPPCSKLICVKGKMCPQIACTLL